MDERKQKNCINEIINISSISKAFSTRSVLNNISFNVTEGQSVSICGPNGVGKSTLLRITAGLLQPDNGLVRICGHDIRKDPEKAKPLLGVISHKSMIYSNLTVFENLSFFGTLYGIEDKNYRIKVTLDDLGLSGYRYDKAEALSRGMLQRLAIARALLHQPKVLLADEPFTGLDSEASEHLISVLTNFTSHGGTIIMTTHDINNGLKCSDRIVVLDKGRLIFDEMKNDINNIAFARDYLSYARNERKT